MIWQNPLYRKRNIPQRTLLAKLAKGHTRGWCNIFINNLIAKFCVAAIEGTGGCKQSDSLNCHREERESLHQATP